MKADTLLCLSDSHLMVYRYASSLISLVDVYDLSETESMGRFAQWLKADQSRTTAVLLDVSCEDYYEERLPHVNGRDRGLLLSRKITKFFPSQGYAHAELSNRLSTGRRDDIYFISGIADTAFIDPLIDTLVNNNLAIRGVYTLPQLAAELIQPIEHSAKLLLVTCEEDSSSPDRYSFRQSFIVNEKLYFSRKTTVAFGSGSDMAEVVRKEIERTWQYLNNRRVLEQDSRMQVLMLLPAPVADCLKAEAEASHCDYVYADAKELAERHLYSSDTGELSSSALAAFILAKSGGRKSHYHPQRLGFIQKHQQIKQLLSLASVLVLALAVVFSTINIMAGLNIKDASEGSAEQSRRLSAELKIQHDSFQYNGPAPQKMQDMVALSERIEEQSALPAPIFSLISGSFSGFNELLLVRIEWRSIAAHESESSGAGRVDASRSSNQAAEGRVVVSLFGELPGFTGDFRHAIERIELLVTRLRSGENVVAVEATRLPLDIDPSLKVSRALSDQRTPGFAIDVTLKRALL